MLYGVLDARDDIRAVPDLAVERRAGVEKSAGRKIVDIHGNGRCADVHGGAVKTLRRIAVLHAEERILMADERERVFLRVAVRAGKLPRRRERNAAEISAAVLRFPLGGRENGFRHRGGKGIVRAAGGEDLRGGVLRNLKKNGDVLRDGRDARAHGLARAAALHENIAFPAAAVAAADELERVAEPGARFGKRPAGDARFVRRSGDTNGIFHKSVLLITDLRPGAYSTRDSGIWSSRGRWTGRAGRCPRRRHRAWPFPAGACSAR